MLDELNPNKQELLTRLNSLINNMCFPAYSPNYSKLYSISYNIVCEAIDTISSEMMSLKANLNIPNDSIDYPHVDESNFK